VSERACVQVCVSVCARTNLHVYTSQHVYEEYSRHCHIPVFWNVTVSLGK